MAKTIQTVENEGVPLLIYHPSGSIPQIHYQTIIIANNDFSETTAVYNFKRNSVTDISSVFTNPNVGVKPF